MGAGVRGWLPPSCLLLLVVAVWVFLGVSKCPDSSWDGSPAIARVGDDCVYALQFSTYLRDLSLSLGFIHQGSEADESSLGDYVRGKQSLASEFGLDNAAFATLAQDLALYRAAVAEGQSPLAGDVMAVMGTNRERIRNLSTVLELHELAKESNLAAFRDLIESPGARQLIPVQGEEHILALFEEAGKIDLSGAAEGMNVHSALLDTIGEERYWTEVFFELAHWLVAIESLRLAVYENEAPLNSALLWQDLREKAWGSTVIELTDAAPEGLTQRNVRQFMKGLHALERDLLTK